MTNCIFILIVFFILLLTYQIFLAHFKNSIVEGNTSYQPYDTTDPNNAMILAQQNAGNISALKTQLDSAVQDISGNVANLQSQINDLVDAQKQSGEQLVGTTTPDISGTE